MDYFYKEETGAVVSMAINKYVYIAVNKKFDSKIRASYSKTETVDRVDDLEHELIRESMRLVGIDGGIEIVSIADIPSGGTGLGSSSSYTVGLLHALHTYCGQVVTRDVLAEEACQVEIERVEKPIGKQDQYIAAYGDIRYMEFNSDGIVTVEPAVYSKMIVNQIQSRLLLLYTGLVRSSDSILKRQKRNVLNDTKKRKVLAKMVELAREMRNDLQRGSIDSFGDLLDRNWQLKKQLEGGISNPEIEGWYELAKQAGATGGKICGAGGGGFLLLYAPKSSHQIILDALPLRQMEFSFEPEGSKVIYME